jgi:hypothetical protein
VSSADNYKLVNMSVNDMNKYLRVHVGRETVDIERLRISTPEVAEYLRGMEEREAAAHLQVAIAAGIQAMSSDRDEFNYQRYQANFQAAEQRLLDGADEFINQMW